MFNPSSPEVKVCGEAGQRLYDKLEAEGVSLMAVGVGVSWNGQQPAIHLMLVRSTDRPIPETFEGYEVHCRVTGRIVPL
jgi:hypothetical protein